MDTDLLDKLRLDTSRALSSLLMTRANEELIKALQSMHLRLSHLESQAAPQETTTETRWERGTTLTDAPACSHEPDPWAIKNAPQLTACIHCAVPMVLRWVPAGSA